MKDKKFKKFEPMTLTVRKTIEDLITRNGKVINETVSYIEIKRMTSIAKIDQWGRVEWRSAD